MRSSPEFDDHTFVKIGLCSLGYIATASSRILRDFKSDRGPYAITAGVFYQICGRVAVRSRKTALVKMNFGPGNDPSENELCRDIERIIDQFHEIHRRLRTRAFNKSDLLLTYINSEVARKTIAVACPEELKLLEQFVLDAGNCYAKWRTRYG